MVRGFTHIQDNRERAGKGFPRFPGPCSPGMPPHVNIDVSGLNDGPPPAQKQKFYRILHAQVIFAIIVGILPWHLCPNIGESMKPLGDAFIKLVRMIIAPVIFLTVVTGIAGMNNMKAVGRVAGKALICFIAFSTLAPVVALVVANIVRPGAGLNIDASTLQSDKVSQYVEKAHASSLTDGNILQVLFVAVIPGGGALQRVSHLQAGAPHQGRAVAGAGHVVFGGGAVHHAGHQCRADADAANHPAGWWPCSAPGARRA